MPLLLGSDPVVIAGGGIGGLAAAVMLARKGIAVSLTEKRAVTEESGAGIQLSPNASRILLDIGLGPKLMRTATAPERVLMRNVASGRRIGEVALGRHMTGRHEAPYLVMARADLHSVLLDAARSLPNVRLQFGRGVGHVAEVSDSVTVTTTSVSGSVESIETPCLVGADGLWSGVRRHLGERRQPRFRGYEAWRATLPTSAAPAFARGNETGLWLGTGIHLVHYPIESGTRINIVAILEARIPREGWSSPGDPERIAARFAHAAKPLRELIALGENWRIWPLYDLPARRMANRRTALLGDAAHPVLPFLAQGGALAIEDAACLAEVLSTTPDDVPLALQAYQRLRLKRAQRVQEAARRAGRAYHLWGPLAAARDAVMKLEGPTGLANRLDWLYGWQLSFD